MNDANPAAAAAGFAYTGWGRQQDLRNDPQVLLFGSGFRSVGQRGIGEAVHL